MTGKEEGLLGELVTGGGALLGELVTLGDGAWFVIFIIFKGDVWVWGPGSGQAHTSPAYPHLECRGQLRESHGDSHGARPTLPGWRKVNGPVGLPGLAHVLGYSFHSFQLTVL